MAGCPGASVGERPATRRVQLVRKGMSKVAVASELGIHRSSVYRALERREGGAG